MSKHIQTTDNVDAAPASSKKKGKAASDDLNMFFPKVGPSFGGRHYVSS